jgi:hypothetical protein
MVQVVGHLVTPTGCRDFGPRLPELLSSAVRIRNFGGHVDKISDLALLRKDKMTRKLIS